MNTSRLSKTVRAAIIRQFKTGDTMEYLADLYGFKLERIEEIIRFEMLRQAEERRLSEGIARL